MIVPGIKKKNSIIITVIIIVIFKYNSDIIGCL